MSRVPRSSARVAVLAGVALSLVAGGAGAAAAQSGAARPRAVSLASARTGLPQLLPFRNDAPAAPGRGKRAGKPVRGASPKSPASVVLRPALPHAAVAPNGRAAYWDGRRFALNPNLAAGPSSNRPLHIPTRAEANLGGGAGGPTINGPALNYGSIQADAAITTCSTPGTNETSIAQSSADPDLVVIAAQAFASSSGCSDSHPWVIYSHDGGRHWQAQVMPGITRTAGGDPSVAFDPHRNVFVYSFMQFDRDGAGNAINASVNVESSADGSSWGNHFVLDSDGTNVAVDKPMTGVDINPSSPHFGRVSVSWTHFAGSSSVYFADFSDTGGASWNTATTSINSSSDNCGNGTDPAFDANGDQMVAWFDCSSGNRLLSEFSTDGGATWPNPDRLVSAVGDMGAGSEGCTTNTSATGTHFRCNSFPSLAGDPNSAGTGGTAFAVVWGNQESSGISQIRGVSTVDGGTTWNFAFFGSSSGNGDKFFPWARFSPGGRLDIAYSSREDSATSTNTKGTTYDEHYTEATSLSRLRGGSSGEFVTMLIDGTASNPGSATFIGDYSGLTSADDDFDVYPVWTDARSGIHVRTLDLCYASCWSQLGPNSTVFASHTAGSSFTDLYRFQTDPSFGGSGGNFWNAVGIRNGSDGTGVDNDMVLFGLRYFSNALASSAFSPPFNDYVLENDNAGHAPSRPYYVNVHSFSTLGGSYAIQWRPGTTVLTSAAAASLGSSDVVKVYDMLDSTGTTVSVGVRPASGNTSIYTLGLHSASGGFYQGAPQAVARANAGGAGQPVFASFATGSDPTQFDAAVLVNDNGGTGAYTIYRDTAAPTGTVSINGGAAATKNANVTLTLSASNPTTGDPVVDMRISTDGGATFGNFIPFATTKAVALPSGDGTKTVVVQFRNGAGVVSANASDTIALDTVAPAKTAASNPSLVVGAAVNTTANRVPVQISWAFTDATSGVCSYTLEESVNGGAFNAVSLPSPTATHLTRQETPGTTHRYEVKATDCAGNASAFTLGRSFEVLAFQETASAITYSATGWTQVSQAGAFGGAVKTAVAAGKTASLAFSGAHQVAWVARKDTSSGSATTKLDGAATQTVNLNSATAQNARLVNVRTVTTASHHYLVTVSGTAGHPKVTVDAFVVLT